MFKALDSVIEMKEQDEFINNISLMGEYLQNDDFVNK